MLLKYGIAWFGIMALAIFNGAAREALYKPYTGELPAHQIATAVLFILITIYLWKLLSFWPMRSSRQAWSIGIMWLVMTLAFETIIGRFISGSPWSRIFYDYNLLAGRVWTFIPLWMLTGPYVLSRKKIKETASA
ncbi:MAG TPA: hypothetical protein VHO43_00050 [Ignavibacteriales bacterium]|nr:hypothetical protein [Ignavibacteriales bacterium]